MWFDVSAALSSLESAGPANPAIPAKPPAPESRNRRNRSAAPSGTDAPAADPVETAVLAALRLGCVRPGAIARRSGLGATETYRALDRLRAAGRVAQARDGTLSETGDARP